MLRSTLAEVCLREEPRRSTLVHVSAQGLRVALRKGRRSKSSFIYEETAEVRVEVIFYEHSPLDRSALYLEALGLFAQGRVRIPGEPKLIAQLRGLERRVGRQGKDTVDHRPGHNDDRANALAGALAMLGKPAAEPGIRRIDGPGPAQLQPRGLSAESWIRGRNYDQY